MKMNPLTNNITYPKPVKLSQALSDYQSYERKYVGMDSDVDIFIKNVRKNPELANMEVNGFIGRGSSALAFETSDGKILKLTEGNHFPFNRPHQKFDVPVYSQGKSGNVCYYVEEKLFQHGLSDGFVYIMKDMIKKAGFRPSDMDDFSIHQIGLSKEGNLYLLDPECAKYKTIFHALLDKFKKICRKR